MVIYLRGKILNVIRDWPDKSFENILLVPKVGYVCLNVRDEIKQTHTLSAFLWLTVLFFPRTWHYVISSSWTLRQVARNVARR